MSKEDIQWLLLVTSNAPIANTKEARHKAAALLKLADDFEQAEREE